MSLSAMSVAVGSGTGVVARFGEAVMVVLTDPDSADPFVAEVRSLAGEPSPGSTLARRLAGLLADPEAPALAALGTAGDDVALIAHGEIEVVVGSEVFRGTDRPTWVDEFVSGESPFFEIRPLGSEAPEFGGDLGTGIVTGSGVRLSAGTVMEETREEEAAPPPAFETIDFGVPELTRDPLPVAEEPLPVAGGEDAVEEMDGVEVQGVQCSRGHFNHPDALYCSSCGISMVQATKVFIPGERPPLGRIVFSDGSTFTIDMDHVLGRDPGSSELVTSDQARPMLLVDDNKVLSRVHAAIRLDGWEVSVVDMGSANGTLIRDGEDWRPLEPDQPEPLKSGSVVKVGDHEFTFDSHHRVG